MEINSILNANFEISSIDDEQGKRDYNFNITFSNNDKINIYKNDLENLLVELPEILSLALQARVINKNNDNIKKRCEL